MLDDERWPGSAHRPGKVIRVCRTSEKAKAVVEAFGLPDEIWFDHDLGDDDTSMKFIFWLQEQLLDLKFRGFPKGFVFSVHSQNPVGKKNIEYAMNTIVDYFGEVE